MRHVFAGLLLSGVLISGARSQAQHSVHPQLQTPIVIQPQPSPPKTDKELAIHHIQALLCCGNACNRIDLANKLLDLLAADPAFLVRPMAQEKHDQPDNLWAVFQQSYGGRAISCEVADIHKAASLHPVLTGDQVVILRIAVYLAMDADKRCVNPQVLRNATLLAGRLVARQLSRQQKELAPLLVLPWYQFAVSIPESGGDSIEPDVPLRSSFAIDPGPPLRRGCRLEMT